MKNNDDLQKRIAQEYKIEFEKQVKKEKDAYWSQKTQEFIDSVTKEFGNSGCVIRWYQLKNQEYEGVTWSPLEIKVNRENYKQVLASTVLKQLEKKDKRFLKWFFEKSGFGSEEMELVVHGKEEITGYALLYHGDKTQNKPEELIKELEIEENEELIAQWKMYLMKHMFEKEEERKEERDALIYKTLMWKMNDVNDRISELLIKEVKSKRDEINAKYKPEYEKERNNIKKKAEKEATLIIKEKYSQLE